MHGGFAIDGPTMIRDDKHSYIHFVNYVTDCVWPGVNYHLRDNSNKGNDEV